MEVANKEATRAEPCQCSCMSTACHMASLTIQRPESAVEEVERHGRDVDGGGGLGLEHRAHRRERGAVVGQKDGVVDLCPAKRRGGRGGVSNRRQYTRYLSNGGAMEAVVVAVAVAVATAALALAIAVAASAEVVARGVGGVLTRP